MQFLENIKAGKALKIAGLAILAIVVVAIAFRLIGSSVNSLLGQRESFNISLQEAPAYDYAYDSAEMVKSEGSGAVGLSSRNAAAEESIMPPSPGTATGATSEEFEITEYGATVETRQLGPTCATVTDLKARDYVIFENANEFDHGCSYYFKVKRANVEEILAIIKGMDPKDFSENTYTIKGLVDDYTSEIEILKNKLAAIDETLAKAVDAYDDVTALATRVQDVESLAKIIDSKINVIERLTQERIRINYELQRIERAKADQLDRLEYTYFRVNIYETKFIDGESLLDEWKESIKAFVRDVNRVAQDITINLVSLLLRLVQVALYLLILLIVVKYGWKLVKYIWRK